MQRRVSAGEARQRLGELLEGVFYRGDEVVIERAGKAMGVVIPVERYQQIEAARQRFWQKVEELREQNRDIEIDDEQLERDIDKAVREVRSQIWAEYQSAQQ